MPACLLILLVFMLQKMKKQLVYVIDDGCMFNIHACSRLESLTRHVTVNVGYHSERRNSPKATSGISIRLSRHVPWGQDDSRKTLTVLFVGHESNTLGSQEENGEAKNG